MNDQSPQVLSRGVEHTAETAHLSDAAADEAMHAASVSPAGTASGTPKRLVIRLVFNRSRVSGAGPFDWLRSSRRAMLPTVVAGCLVLGLILYVALTEQAAHDPAQRPGANPTRSADFAAKVPPQANRSAKTMPRSEEPVPEANSAHPGRPPGDAHLADIPSRSAVPAPGESSGMSPNPGASASPQLQRLTEKRNLLRSVQLANFSWRPDVTKHALILDLTVRNKSALHIREIEVVCSQHAKDLTLLETSKMLLPGQLEPKTRRTFRSVVGGLLNRSTYRVHCVISDASAAAALGDR